jgi:membrane-bound lytic murein transglycosylase D
MVSNFLQRNVFCLLALVYASSTLAATSQGRPLQSPISKVQLEVHRDLRQPVNKDFSPPIFDFPVTYNEQVRNWVRYFQNQGRQSFKIWLERSARYAPYIQKELERNKLPQDLLYVAMIESGFAPHATSHAGAVGMWQFIKPTAQRYGLKVNSWVDERRNFTKATRAAIRYKKDLYQMFGSWHLVSASYNTGENRIHRLIQKHQTNSFWDLAAMRALPDETIDYVPKIIAATLIAKSPALYGFRDLDYSIPYKFEEIYVPGGTDLQSLAEYLNVDQRYLKELNPDLLRGFVPREVRKHLIKVPIGSKSLVQRYIEMISQVAT